MYPFYQMHGAQQIGFTRPRCTAALIHTGDRALRAQNNRTTGAAFFVVSTANEDIWNSGQTIVQGNRSFSNQAGQADSARLTAR
ncbi:MAG: hypothetical protein Fur0018_15060 [Anaerolineales bacterium]